MKKIAFISGVFDGLHRGHRLILAEMRKLAPYVVVAINSDAYAARKGPGRPLVTLEDRRAALYGTGLVDEVIAIENTPLQVIQALKPDFICVGRADYKPEQVVGYKECQEWGGQVVIIPEDLGVSTTQMVKAAGQGDYILAIDPSNGPLQDHYAKIVVTVKKKLS